MNMILSWNICPLGGNGEISLAWNSPQVTEKRQLIRAKLCMPQQMQIIAVIGIDGTIEHEAN